MSLLQNKNKRLLCVCIILLQVLLLFMTQNTTDVFAESDPSSVKIYCYICETEHALDTGDKTCCILCREQHDMSELSAIGIFAYEQNAKVESGQVISDSALDILRFDMQSSRYAGLWAKAQQYYDTLAPIGMILSVIYVLVALLDGAGKESLNPERIFKALAKIFLSVLIITIGFDIIQAGIDFAVGVFDIIMAEAPEAVTGDDLSSKCIYEAMAGSGVVGEILWLILRTIKHLVPYIVLLVVSTTINLVIWARLLDLIIRTILAPIGIADLAEMGLQGNGWRYLKRLIASALSGAVCLACVFGYRLLKETATESFGAIGSGIIGIVLGISLLSTLFQVKDMAEDIVGV